MQKEDAILKTLRRIEDHQASLDRDLEKDRRDIQDVLIRLQTLEEEVRQTRKAVNTNIDRVRDRVVEAVEPVLDITEDLKIGINNKKKVLLLKEKSKSWLKKIWR